MDIAYAVDLARGIGPLTFDRDANPNGLRPEVCAEPGGRFVRLAVQAGAYGAATRGEPHLCDRCEIRDPDKLPMAQPAWYGFSLRVPPGFPASRSRFVAAQVKANGGASPLFALRIVEGRLFADWRIGSVAVEHHDAIPAPADRWHAIMLGFVGDRAEFWVAGRHVASARAGFETMATRYLKVGPYRDKHPSWGHGPAAIDVRDIRRGSSRAAIEPAGLRAA